MYLNEVNFRGVQSCYCFFFFTSSVATNKAKGKASDDPCNRSVITMLKAVKGLDPLILVE